MLRHHLETPIGTLIAIADDAGLRSLLFPGHRVPSAIETIPRSDRGFEALTEQLAEYFAGDRHHFELPLALRGTPFQLRAWDALRQIPYGQTRSYGEQAAMLGGPESAHTLARAVGLANNRNPISIIVPCHRVVGADGSLVGYGGGLPIKRYLLDLESAAQPLFTF
ncbi:methylated-DNA--[protein]-cysteine S-methyltransferase [Pseudactinotalea suaedae]|uniref:methylated-DNA--[protein]-cysteine S-methyltransferase n=1 Tax=Pseudactinotalea suaedae TaxID=1524924 RepID=UPI0014788A14|nr:methylated-DNA--[protein]-cysteine S-methyltransferase [Pseudactinotalea suaedae]